MDLEGYAAQNTTPSVSQHILTTIKTGDFYTHLPFHTDESCKVQFANAARHLYEKKYFFTITLATTIPRGVRLLLVFPERRVVLDTSEERDVASINRFIDTNLSRDPKTIQMVLCVGDSLYKVSGVTGRLYMHWAATLEYTSGRTPTRWKQAPILATTNGQFCCTGLFPVFGQEKFHSFIRKGCESITSPTGFVVWSLDGEAPKQAVEHEAVSKAMVADRAQRDMIPDHEMHKYQSRVAASAGNQSETTSDTEEPHGRGETSTASEDYDSVIVHVKELPTPRPFAPTQAVSLALTSGFFDLDADSAPSSSPDTASMRPPSQSQRHNDFALSSVPSNGSNSRWHEDRDNVPMVPLFSPPKDSRATRTATAGRPNARVEDSSE